VDLGQPDAKFRGLLVADLGGIDPAELPVGLAADSPQEPT